MMTQLGRNMSQVGHCRGIMTRDIMFPHVITVIKCNSTNFQKTVFHYTYSKLYENLINLI